MKVQVAQLHPTLCNPRPEYWSGWPFPSPGDLHNPGIKPWIPGLQVDSLPAEPQGKPKNTGVGSLSLLQGYLPLPGIKPGSPELQADSLPTELSGKPISHKNEKILCSEAYLTLPTSFSFSTTVLLFHLNNNFSYKCFFLQI